VLVSRHVDFPYTQDLRRLLIHIRGSGIEVPARVEEALILTPFAFEFRYPGAGPVTEAHYREAVEIAEAVVRWAEETIARPAAP
jgi:HEPN domain-containing protein